MNHPFSIPLSFLHPVSFFGRPTTLFIGQEVVGPLDVDSRLPGDRLDDAPVYYLYNLGCVVPGR